VRKTKAAIEPGRRTTVIALATNTVVLQDVAIEQGTHRAPRLRAISGDLLRWRKQALRQRDAHLSTQYLE
jgi:hypothetical protein